MQFKKRNMSFCIVNIFDRNLAVLNRMFVELNSVQVALLLKNVNDIEIWMQLSIKED